MRNISVTEIQLLEIVKGNIFGGGEGETVPLNKTECLTLHSIKVYFVGMCLKIFKMLIPCFIVMSIFHLDSGEKKIQTTISTVFQFSTEHFLSCAAVVGREISLFSKGRFMLNLFPEAGRQIFLPDISHHCIN